MVLAGRNFQVLDHSLVRHHLGRVRSTEAGSESFRAGISRLATLLAVEATRDLPLSTVNVTTPLEDVICDCIQGRIAIVPILRAGLGMVEPILTLIPFAEVWHLGLYRDEATAKPVHYYDKLPNSNPVDEAFVVDPMLATGGSACAALQTLSDWGVPRLKLLTAIASPEGVDTVGMRFPDVAIYTCSIDRELNAQKFIVPGLGDAGDRIFNTIPPAAKES